MERRATAKQRSPSGSPIASGSTSGFRARSPKMDSSSSSTTRPATKRSRSRRKAFSRRRNVDTRWVKIRRPTVIVGGELTMDNLEIRHDPRSNVSEASIQLKSNCGCLLIDDFGRQRIDPTDLLESLDRAAGMPARFSHAGDGQEDPGAVRAVDHFLDEPGAA